MYVSCSVAPAWSTAHKTAMGHQGPVPERHFVELREEKQALVFAYVGLASHIWGYLKKTNTKHINEVTVLEQINQMSKHEWVMKHAGKTSFELHFDSSKEHGEKSVCNGSMGGNMGKCVATPPLANTQCTVPSPETLKVYKCAKGWLLCTHLSFFTFSSPDTTWKTSL